MNFDLSEEQSLLRDLIDRFAADRYDPVRRLAYLRQARGFDDECWAMLAETGLLAFPFAAEHGGFGGGAVELITVMEAMGRGALVEPVLPLVVLGGSLLERGGTAEQVERILPAVIAGERSVCFAHCERGGRFDVTIPATRATGRGDDVRITGTKIAVMAGAFADHYIVTAQEEGGVSALYLVDAGAAGITRRDYRLIDGTFASDIMFADTPAQPMAGGQDVMATVMADARLAICAELVGLMTLMFDATLDYVKTRAQFGQAIGQFQAIQHRMADNYARLELSRSQLYRAASQDPGTPAAMAAIVGAKAYISANAVALGEESVQLHGGIGTTEELMVGQAFKRVLMLSALFGDAEWDRRHYARLAATA